MDLFANVNIKWMRHKWYFISVSFLLLIIGWSAVIKRGGFKYGIDFKGGTLVEVKFAQKPDLSKIRKVLKRAKLEVAEVTRFDEESRNEVQIKFKAVKKEDVKTFQNMRGLIYEILKNSFDSGVSEKKLDINNVGKDVLASTLLKSQILEKMGIIKSGALDEERVAKYNEIASKIATYRTKHGIIKSFDELSALDIPKPLLDYIKDNFFCGSFTILGVESVGPKIGKELRKKAILAIVLSLLGMLIYIAFRFKFSFGVGAVVALFHDVLITLGLFTLIGKEINLPVVAALLTLVGYSINDSIVVFDRIRENMRLMRNENFIKIIDDSINQTLSRTVITSGTTFVSVLALYLFGGEVLSGFSIVLVIGIIVGTYSSIAIASPIVLWWVKFFGSEEDKKRLKLAAK